MRLQTKLASLLHDTLHIAHYTFLVSSLTAAGCAAQKPLMSVIVPLTDLRAQPHTAAQPAAHDPLEETQLVYGEQVQVLKTEDGWAQVEAVEQPEFTHARRWQGYPGWVPATQLVPSDPMTPPTIVASERAVTVTRTSTLEPPGTSASCCESVKGAL